MPMLDVSDVLLDPMFMDVLQITRRAYITDDNGRVQVTETELRPRGVVTQGSPNPFEQESDEQYGKTAITIHAYNFQLYDPTTGPTQNYQPDVLTYNGNRYIITNVLNWSRYGTGFTMATAALYNPTSSGAS